VRRDYTRELIREFAHDCRVTLVGAERLATLAEAALRGKTGDLPAIRAEILPAFVDDGARTDTIVLACTHYPLILEALEKVAPWPVTWIDPAPAIARRASQLLGPEGGWSGVATKAYFTSGSIASKAVCKSLAHFGVEVARGQPVALAV
jgi:glutamate racemase